MTTTTTTTAAVDLDRFAQPGEAKAARALLRRALSAGYAVSVYDGEEWTVRRSRKFEELEGALASTDHDTIRLDRQDFNNASGWHFVGTILLVWGNAADGSELAADCSDNPATVDVAGLA